MTEQRVPTWLITDLLIIVAGIMVTGIVIWIAP